MSLRCLCTALLLGLIVLTTGCCCHKKHRHDCCSCYSSPASRTEAPTFTTIPSADPAK